MNLIIIIGAHAAGKMSVGKEIADRTTFKLFHNHMSIEMPLQIFDYGTSSFFRLANTIRNVVFEEAMSSDTNLIFTYICAFNHKEDVDYLNNLIHRFEDNGHNVYLLELFANVEERLKRNQTEYRITEKPSKRDIEWSNKDLLQGDKKYRMRSNDGELECKNYLFVDNTNLEPSEVAEKFINEFSLK